MKTAEDVWGKWIQFENTKIDKSESSQLLQPKEKKTLCSEKEFEEIFSDFFGNIKKN